jgi:WXG100 family type VII secretion target
MSNYQFNFQTADYTLNSMNTINVRIRSGLDDLQSSVEASLADWEGSAQEAYWQAKARWNAAANEMSMHLGSARSTLSNISDGYGSAEQRATQIWQSGR